MEYQVRVSGLPRCIDDEGVCGIFNECKIRSIVYIGNADDLKQSAIITFSSEDEARAAVARYDHCDVDGVPLSVVLLPAEDRQNQVMPQGFMQSVAHSEQSPLFGFPDNPIGSQDSVGMQPYPGPGQSVLPPQMRLPPQNPPPDMPPQFIQQSPGMGQMPQMPPFPMPMFNQAFPPPMQPIPIPMHQIAMMNQQGFPPNQKHDPQRYDELVKFLRIYREELIARGNRIMNAMN